jgi:excisionase family DNA binding protein
VSGIAQFGRGSAPLAQAPSSDRLSETPLLTARTVADKLDVCTETILRWIRNGELPAIRLPGGAVRIVESELSNWLLLRATPRRGVLATGLDAAEGRRYGQGHGA